MSCFLLYGDIVVVGCVEGALNMCKALLFVRLRC